MTVPVAHTPFAPGDLDAADLNVRFNELRGILTRGIQDDNVDTIGPEVIAGYAITLTGGSNQNVSRATEVQGRFTVEGVWAFQSEDVDDERAVVSVARSSHVKFTLVDPGEPLFDVTEFSDASTGQAASQGDYHQIFLVNLLFNVNGARATIKDGGKIATANNDDIVNRAPGAGQVRSRYTGWISASGISTIAVELFRGKTQ